MVWTHNQNEAQISHLQEQVIPEWKKPEMPRYRKEILEVSRYRRDNLEMAGYRLGEKVILSAKILTYSLLLLISDR